MRGPGMVEEHEPSLSLLLLCFQADVISRTKHVLWLLAATMCPLHLCHPWLAVLHLGTSTEGSQAMVTFSVVVFGCPRHCPPTVPTLPKDFMRLNTVTLSKVSDTSVSMVENVTAVHSGSNKQTIAFWISSQLWHLSLRFSLFFWCWARKPAHKIYNYIEFSLKRTFYGMIHSLPSLPFILSLML